MNSKSHTPSVAAVILNWNGKKYLEKYLPFVLKTDYENFHIVVADNASSDDSVMFMKEQYPDIELIILDKNYGFAEGYNRALKKVSSDYFVLLNSDVAVTPGWVSPVIKLMESDSSIAACQPKILSEPNKELFEYAGASGGWLDKFGYAFCRGRVFDVCEEDMGQYDNVAEVFWASGACFFVRSDIFKNSGGFDPCFFAHQEEIDLCWRLKNDGYRIFVQPQSVVYHLGGGSLAMGSKKKVYLNFRNSLLVLYKNLQPRERIYKIFVRMTLDQLAFLQFLLKGRAGSAFAIIKAHFAFYKWMFFKKKQQLSPKRMKTLAGVYEGSIVWGYFLKSKKTFSKIVDNKK